MRNAYPTLRGTQTGVPRERLRSHPSNLIRLIPAKGGSEVQEQTPSWGVEPVPQRLHVLSGLDSTLLWGNLSVSLLVIVIGALLVPALSLRDALLAILVGAVAGNVLLAVAALIGADARVPGDGAAARAARAPWLVPADRAQRRAERRLVDVRAHHHRDRRRRALAASLPLAGALVLDARLRRRSAGRSACSARSGSCAAISARSRLGAALLDGLPHVLGDLASRTCTRSGPRPARAGSRRSARRSTSSSAASSRGRRSSPTTRASRARAAARRLGAGFGYFVPTVWCIGLGASSSSRAASSDAQSLPTAVAAAGGVAFAALLAITIDESEKAFADIYSTAVSLQNFLPRVSQRLLITVVSVVATGARARARTSGTTRTSSTCSARSSCRSSASSLADWLAARAHYSAASTCSTAPEWRPAQLVAWLVGFGLYQWLSPVGPAGGRGSSRTRTRSACTFTASLPSFAAAFLLALALTLPGPCGRSPSSGISRVT